MRDRRFTRLVLTWAAWSITVLILAEAGKGIGGRGRDPWEHTPIPRPVPPLARWDSGWYYWIATQGYSYDPSVKQTPVGFYPLYPLLVRATVAVTRTPVFWTGIALSLICFLGALALIQDLTRSWAPDGNPDDTTYSIFFFPTAFFFAAFYTESLFLLTTAAALWGARRQNWGMAAMAGAAAALTRFNGMLILLPLALCALAEGGWKVRNVRLKHVAALAAVTAGAAAYPAFLWYRWGSPLLYIQNKTTTGTQSILAPTHLLGNAFRNAIRNFSSPTSGGQIRFWLEIGSLLGFAVLTFLLFRRRLVPEGCYCAATLLLFSCTGTLDGVHRYVLALFPCFFLIGDLLRRAQTAQFVYRYAGASLNTILIARFAHWAWVA